MKPPPLSLREKFGYGLGDMASNIVYQAVINVLMYFYTDVYGIEAAAAGTLMIVVRLFDAITDPIMGAVADRTRSRWGRYRPWLLWDGRSLRHPRCRCLHHAERVGRQPSWCTPTSPTRC
jgi:Na+/melibiose symporter-like transporter